MRSRSYQRGSATVSSPQSQPSGRQQVSLPHAPLRHRGSRGVSITARPPSLRPLLRTAPPCTPAPPPAEYFFRPGVEGKRLRPTLALPDGLRALLQCARPRFLQVDLKPASEHTPELRRQQQRLAEISETIHVASLLHDDVLDDATMRRGVTALNINVGNKTAILAGDYLLARASVSLAALRNCETVELMSQVLENLVAGEIMQVRAGEGGRLWKGGGGEGAKEHRQQRQRGKGRRISPPSPEP